MRALVLTLALLAPAAASAQDAFRFPADRFQPALDVDGLSVVDWAGVPPHLAVDAALIVGYEDDALVIEQLGARRLLVGSRLRADVLASIALFEWVQIGAAVPVALFQGRDAGLAATVGDRHPLRGFGPGDARLRLKARVLSQRHGAPLDLAVVPELTVPSSALPDWFGEAGFTFAPHVAASTRLGPLKLSSSVGVLFRAPDDDLLLPLHQELSLEGAAGWVFDVVPERPTEVSVAVATAASIAAAAPPQSTQLLVEVEHRVWGPFVAVVGGGAGFGRATPDFRLYAGARFAAGRGAWPW